MLARLRSAAVHGIDAYPVEVEVDLAPGLPFFATVGLAQGAIKEGRERVTASLANSGFEFPLQRVTVNLAPADRPKDGSAFDLPIALGVLAASGQLPPASLARHLVVGELGLAGELRPVRGALSMALAARAAGMAAILLPALNAPEAAVVEGLEVHGADSLGSAVRHLTGTAPIARAAREPLVAGGPGEGAGPDFAEVRGQVAAKRALEIAAAGAHNVLLVGPPGAGKTMLARRLPTILPAPTLEEALAVTKIQSVAGLLPPGASLARARPFRAPHHTVSDAGLIGGGTHPRPGEVSLAHGGVLFLDELPEFQRHVLEVLRQPLEDGTVTLSRAAGRLTYPARFTLVAAMNPCPCGRLGDPVHACTCGALLVDRYRSRISGPLLDRIDLHLTVPAIRWTEFAAPAAAEGSAAIRARVEAARERQRARGQGGEAGLANAELTIRDVRRWCSLSAEGSGVLQLAVERLGLSARGYHRVLKVARTIADLAGEEGIAPPHLREAIQYRALDRRSLPPVPAG